MAAPVCRLVRLMADQLNPDEEVLLQVFPPAASPHTHTHHLPSLRCPRRSRPPRSIASQFTSIRRLHRLRKLRLNPLRQKVGPVRSPSRQRRYGEQSMRPMSRNGDSARLSSARRPKNSALSGRRGASRKSRRASSARASPRSAMSAVDGRVSAPPLATRPQAQRT